MALPVSRIRVPVALEYTIFRCKSTAATSSMIDAKSRVKEHARHISRSTVSKATPAPAYVLLVALFPPFKI